MPNGVPEAAPPPFDPSRPFPAQRYRLRFRLGVLYRPRAFIGPALRGAFGHTLREALCLTGAPTCDGCLALARCRWPRVFETSVLASLPDRHQGEAGWAIAPLLPVGRRMQPGEVFDVELALFGQSRADLTLLARRLIAAVSRLPEPALAGAAFEGLFLGDALLSPDPRTIPAGHGQEFPPPPPAPQSSRYLLEWLSPLRMTRDGADLPIAAWRPQDLVHSLCRRIRQVLAEHCGQEREVRLPWPDLSPLGKLRLDVSAMRETIVPAGRNADGRPRRLRAHLGVLGLEGPTELLAALWPLLWIGQHLQIGKNPRAGFGRYRLVAA